MRRSGRVGTRGSAGSLLLSTATTSANRGIGAIGRRSYRPPVTWSGAGGCHNGGMRAVVQRVVEADVTVDGEVVGAIDRGLTMLMGVTDGDTENDAETLVTKVVGLRVFADETSAMNLSLRDVGGALLVVSQFTLYGDVRKGRRPSFTTAAGPDVAEPLVGHAVAVAENMGVSVATGRFGAHMLVSSVNDGPVTIILETRDGRLV